MNKKETTKELNDFIVYNSEDILNLYNKEPELGNAFNLLLNALSKEYGSGENIEIKQPETQLEIQPEIKPKAVKAEIKVGDFYRIVNQEGYINITEINPPYIKYIDRKSKLYTDNYNKILTALEQNGLKKIPGIGEKVKIPLTKSEGSEIQDSQVVKRAKALGQNYLYVKEIINNKISLVEVYTPGAGGDYFSLSKDNIELYEEPKQFKEGDKVKIPKTKYGNTLIDFQVIKEAKSKNQDFLYISEIDGDKVELADDKYKTGIYFLFSKDNIELYEEPKQSVTNFKVGDKVKLPLTKSAGALSYDESAVIRNAKKNNQDYAFVSKIDKDVIGLMSADMKYTDSFSISKDNIQRYEEAEDFSKMTNDQLINKKNEIISAMSYFEEEDPEFQELAIQLEEISLYI